MFYLKEVCNKKRRINQQVHLQQQQHKIMPDFDLLFIKCY